MWPDFQARGKDSERVLSRETLFGAVAAAANFCNAVGNNGQLIIPSRKCEYKRA
jgi:hypothetical protein